MWPTHLLSLHPALDVYTAAAVGDAERVLSEIDRDPALIESYSSDGWTPLHLAAFFGHQATAEKLIERGANMEARSTNAMKNTPLHAAAAGRKLGLVKLLLEEGADANARQEGGWTALHAAAQNGDREIVELLVAHGADLNARADNNQGALDLALMKGRQDVAEFLNELGARLAIIVAHARSTTGRIAALDSGPIRVGRSTDELEAARVDALGRKGTLAQISKEFGKLAPDRARSRSANC